MNYLALYIKNTSQFQVDSKIILLFQKVICINLYIPQLYLVMEIFLRSKFEQKKWMKLLKQVLQHTGDIKKAKITIQKQNNEILKKSCIGSVILYQFLKKILILMRKNILKTYQKIFLMLTFLFLHQKVKS